MVDPSRAETLVRIYFVSIVGTELPLIFTVSVRDKAVELLQNIERHFLLGINERDDLKLKHDFFVFNTRLHRSCIVGHIVDIRKGANRDRNLLA